MWAFALLAEPFTLDAQAELSQAVRLVLRTGGESLRAAEPLDVAAGPIEAVTPQREAAQDVVGDAGEAGPRALEEKWRVKQELSRLPKSAEERALLLRGLARKPARDRAETGPASSDRGTLHAAVASDDAVLKVCVQRASTTANATTPRAGASAVGGQHHVQRDD